jgi:hypothetical protein
MFFPLNISLLIRDLQLIFYDRSEVIDYALQEYRIKIRFRESRCKRAIYTVELPLYMLHWPLSSDRMV